MRDDDLRGLLRACLQGLGVAPPPDPELPVALLRAVLERLRALEAVGGEGQEPFAPGQQEGGPWTCSS